MITRNALGRAAACSTPPARRSMARAATVLVVAGCAALTACGSAAGDGASATASTAPVTSLVHQSSPAASAASDQPPPNPKPTADGPCPYLATSWVEEANGEHIKKVELSSDAPRPACFFVRPDGEIDATVWVFSGTAKAANALVNRAAPVDTSSLTNEPAGWTGGLESFGKAKGAVYAVRKEGSGIAVIVTTNQAQTIKAKRIAEETIHNLGL